MKKLWCSWCGKEKDEIEFDRYAPAKTGRYDHCILCRERRKEKNAANKNH